MKTTPNRLADIGISQAAADARIEEAFAAIFTDAKERFYFETDGDAGYLLDTGNLDARTEGMSYGMMMAVQMNRRDLFDRLWRFSKRYMYNGDGPYAGYFAWSVRPDGMRNSDGPAPDGEEYFAMALFFASARWGDGEPPLDYTAQARDILHHAVHQQALVPGGHPLWDPESALIKFVPELPFSDPSYHLPHFYERFAALANREDRVFWSRAALASRAYLARACHPVTGLAPEYALLDGTPEKESGHGDFYSDAYRVAMNIGLDCGWFGRSPEYTAIAERLQRFLWKREPFRTYAVDGTEKDPPALHPTAIIATTAAASLATDTPLSREWVRLFWETPMRRGNRRYYDNCLYFFSLLMLAGRYAMLA
ncbi:MAG: xylanase [Clostridiales bacterium]|nr:xylanase [Clostridiales bacterium]